MHVTLERKSAGCEVTKVRIRSTTTGVHGSCAGFLLKVSKEMKIFDNGETLKNVFVMNFEDNADETKEKR